MIPYIKISLLMIKQLSSIMEDLKVQAQSYDTATSDGFPQIFKSLSKSQSASGECSSSQKPQRENIQQLILRIRQCLQCNNILLQKIKCNDELKTHMSETLQELTILKAQIDGKTSLSKEQFQQQMNQMERLANAMKKQWKEFKENQQKMIGLQINQLKQDKTQNQITLTKILKDTSLEIKCKFAKFGKQFKDFKKNRSDKKNMFFTEIQKIRGILDESLQFERKKRCEYEQIILTLLDKTCDQGQKILRRIC